MNIHFILQSKGGVGKSFIATMFTQFFIHRNKNTACIDIDPANASFTAFKELNVKYIDILDPESKEIDPAKFDELIEYISSLDCENLIVDSGASNFIPFNNYIINCDVVEVLRSMGHTVIIHTVIVGGSGLADTMQALDLLCTNYRNYSVPIYVWLNPYFGDISLNGIKFDESKVYQNNSDIITGLIYLPKFDKTFITDLTNVLQMNITLESAIPLPELKIMQKQRIKNIQRSIFDAINPYFGE